jgi:predicted nucleic acid-binding protein
MSTGFGAMTGSNIFVDTAPVIYLVERNPAFVDKVSNFLAESIQTNKNLVTSVLTISEIAIKPFKTSRPQLLSQFDKTIKSLFYVYLISWEVAELSAKLRAQYRSLKAIDSLQLASAIHYNCECFLTNDWQLKMVKNIPIRVIKDL